MISSKKTKQKFANNFFGFFSQKKGMGISQVFVFIVAGITFALIAIFGYRAITGFLDSGEQVEFTQFKTDLDTSIKKIYTEYGAIRKETFFVPGSYEKVCFVDLDYPWNKIEGEMDGLCAEDQIACNSWQDAYDRQKEGLSGYENVDQNVFLTPVAPVSIKVFSLSLFDINTEQRVGYLCEDVVGGQFTIMLEGKGDHTEISRIPTKTS